MADQNTQNAELGIGGFGRLYAALVGEDSDASGVSPFAEGFGIDDTVRRIIAAEDPVAFLRRFVRQARAADDACALVRRLVERLEDAGLFEDEPALPGLRAVRIVTSGLVYLRTDGKRLPYLAKLRVIAMEATINSALLCAGVLDDYVKASMEDVVKAEQRVCRSVVARASEPMECLEGAAGSGEWADRLAVSAAIECLPLPYRLSASFRMNASQGMAAIEFDVTPPALMPRRCYVDGIGVVPASSSMRRRYATDYNLRVLILLGAYTLLSCEDLDQVWVAAVEDTATRHACYCSAVVKREDVEGIDLTKVDPAAFLRFIDAHMDENAGELACVRQGFSLDEKRFCPPGRFEVVELSDRELRSDESRSSLGSERLSDLAVNEAAAREEAANVAASRLTESTEANVRMLLSLGDEVGDEDVKATLRRVASDLIAGTLDESDPEAVGKAIAGAGDLASKVREANLLLTKGDAQGCASAIASALAPYESQGLYEDADGVMWRSFGTYTERAVFNRDLWDKKSVVRLVPTEYLDALNLLAMCDMILGRHEAALEISRKATTIAPLSSELALSLVNCLDTVGDVDGAFEQCRRTLLRAVDTQGIGLTYITLAGLEFRQGHMQSSQACYQMARRFLPDGLVEAVRRIAQLLGASSDESFSEEHMLVALEARGIPVAPPQHTAEAVQEIAAAAVDEGLFDVARDACARLVSFTRDDIYYGVLRSLEREPDC